MQSERWGNRNQFLKRPRNWLKRKVRQILPCSQEFGDSRLCISGLSLKETKTDINKYSVEEVLDKADEFIEQYNYEMAQKFLERALEINSDHPRALETAASLLIEVRNQNHDLSLVKWQEI